MPKRLRPEELRAARAAGDPPRSEDYATDGEWHAAQNGWLERWQPGQALPGADDKRRRKEWDKLTKKAARHIKVAHDDRPPVRAAANAALSTPPPGTLPPLPPPVVAAVHDRDWELLALRAMCLGRKVDHIPTDSNEDLIRKLARQAKKLAAPPPVPARPSTPPPATAHRPVASLSVGELRQECRSLRIEHSISDTRLQLEKKLQDARDSGPVSPSA